MRLKTLLVVVALAVWFSVSAPKTFAQNLLANGSFETGDFTGWNTGGNFEDTEVVSGAFDQYTGAEDGNFYVVMGPVGSDGTMGQSFTDHAGTSYTFSFWFAAVGDNPSDFSAYWDGTSVLSPDKPHHRRRLDAVLVQRNRNGQRQHFVQFPGRSCVHGSGQRCCVVVSTSTTGTTPEPSSLILLGTGVLGIGWIRAPQAD